MLSPDQKLSHGGEGRNNTGTQNQRKCEEDTNPQGHKPHPWPRVPHVPSRPSTARSFQPPVIILNLQTNPAIRAHSRSVCACNSARKGPRLQCWELCVPLSRQSSVHPSILSPQGWPQPCLLLQLHPKFTVGNLLPATLPTHPLLRHGGDTRDQTLPRASTTPCTPKQNRLFYFTIFESLPRAGPSLQHSSLPAQPPLEKLWMQG